MAPTPDRRVRMRPPRRAGAIVVLLLLLAPACERARPRAEREARAPVDARADAAPVPDSGASVRAVSVRLERVASIRPAALDLPAPEAPADSSIPEVAPAPQVQAGLLAPIALTEPAKARARGALADSVVLEMRVNERGVVDWTRLAAGSSEP